MSTLAIVEHLGVLKQTLTRLVMVAVNLVIDQLRFGRAEETLRHRVAMRTGRDIDSGSFSWLRF
jgi:hypothetical protein